MTRNETVIRNNFDKYVALYTDKFGVKPKSWFQYLRWLAESNAGNTFQPNENKIAIELFGGISWESKL